MSVYIRMHDICIYMCIYIYICIHTYVRVSVPNVFLTCSQSVPNVCVTSASLSDQPFPPNVFLTCS